MHSDHSDDRGPRSHPEPGPEPHSGAAPPRRRRRWLLAVTCAAALFVLAEGSLRVWLYARERPYSAWKTARSLQRGLDPLHPLTGVFADAGSTPARSTDRRGSPGTAVLHPYAGGELSHDTGGVLAFFRAGVPESTATVLVVGGSLAASWVERSGAAFVARVREHERFSGREVRLLNYAHPSYKQPQQLMRVAYLLSLGYRPDVVINVDGFSEVALGLDNLEAGTHPLYPSQLLWGHPLRERTREVDIDHLAHAWRYYDDTRRALERFVGLRLHYSSLLGTLALGWLERRSTGAPRLIAPASPLERDDSSEPSDVETVGNDVELVEASRRPAQATPRESRAVAAIARERQALGPVFAPNARAALRTSARSWFESSLSLHALCRRRSIPYLHVLQPTLYEPGAKPLSTEEEALSVPAAWSQGALEGYRLLRAHGQVLRTLGVAFHDASQLFAEEERTLYTEADELGERGGGMLAAEIATALLRN